MKSKQTLVKILVVFVLALIFDSCSTSKKDDNSEPKIRLDSIMISAFQKKINPILERNDSGQAIIVANRLYPFTNNYAVITCGYGCGYFIRKDGAILKEYPINFESADVDDCYVDENDFVDLKFNPIKVKHDKRYYEVNEHGYVHYVPGILHNLNDSLTKRSLLDYLNRNHSNDYFVYYTEGRSVDTLGYTNFKTYDYFVYSRNLNKLFELNAFSLFILGEGMFAYGDKSSYWSEIYGLVSSEGKKLTKPIYSSISSFQSGYAKVSKYDEFNNQKWGFIDSKGNEVVEIKYSNEPTSMSCNRAFVRSSSGAYSLIDTKGNHLTEDIYLSVNDFCKGQALVKDRKSVSYQIIDSLGNVVTTFGNEYFSIEPNNDCYLTVKSRENGKAGIINYSGEVICDLKFDYLDRFSSGLAIARMTTKEGKNLYGYIDINGEYKILVKEESKY
jgi:hypothetical protein